VGCHDYQTIEKLQIILKIEHRTKKTDER
jgi:hypothetical protein